MLKALEFRSCNLQFRALFGTATTNARNVGETIPDFVYYQICNTVGIRNVGENVKLQIYKAVYLPRWEWKQGPSRKAHKQDYNCENDFFMENIRENQERKNKNWDNKRRASDTLFENNYRKSTTWIVWTHL